MKRQQSVDAAENSEMKTRFKLEIRNFVQGTLPSQAKTCPRKLPAKIYTAMLNAFIVTGLPSSADMQE